MSGRRELGNCFAEGLTALRTAIGASKSRTGHKGSKLTQQTGCTERGNSESMDVANTGRSSHLMPTCLHISCPAGPHQGRRLSAAGQSWAGLHQGAHPSPSSSIMQRLLASRRSWHSSVAIKAVRHSCHSRHSMHTGGQKGWESSRHSSCVQAAFGKELDLATPPHLQMQLRAPGRSSSTSAVAERTTESLPAGLRGSRPQTRALDCAPPHQDFTWEKRAGAAAVHHLNGSHPPPNKSGVLSRPAEQACSLMSFSSTSSCSI